MDVDSTAERGFDCRMWIRLPDVMHEKVESRM